MRYALLALMTFLAGTVASDAPSQAAPGAGLAAAAPNVAGARLEKVDYLRRYYRRYGYPPVAVPVPVPVPDAPPVVGAAPLVVVPLRPASCGQFRYWNGQACVDARFNTPYIGPR
jgi:hypothetical protein